MYNLLVGSAKPNGGRSRYLAGWAGMALATVMLLFPLGLRAAVPNPTVTGPIPATVPPGDPSRNYPFFATDVNLAQYGYVEQEYFMQGTANQYSTPAGATGSVISTGHPYKTRIVVRRPTSQAAFNGIVIVEWYNVTNGFDVELDWFQTRNYLLAHGYAWVGVSAQMVGVNYLRTWSPAGRYASLDVTAGGTITDDSLSYDIFAQAGQAILNPSGVNLLPGLTVKTVIPTGDSQSASRLSTYINSVHPLNPIFPGFFLHSSLGNVIRPDLGNVKVFKYLTESDVLVLGEAAVRRPDTSNFVTWETAGTSHADYWGLLNSQAIRARDATPYPMNPPCPYQLTRSRILAYRGQDAAYDHMVNWIQNNTQPPSAPRLDLSQITPSVVPVRDSYGNILGGLRLADFQVPIATDTGYNVNTPAAPGILCFVLGQYIPFSQQMLSRLYPNHGSYILKTAAASAGNVADGYMLPEDEGDANATAAESDIGGTQLNALNLAEINFQGISVPNTALTSDNLSGDNLSNGNLQGDSLQGANLAGVNLSGTNLSGVTLQGANLQNANFTDTNLSGAKLQGANLRGAVWSNTVCPDGTNSNQNVGFSCTGHLGV